MKSLRNAVIDASPWFGSNATNIFINLLPIVILFMWAQTRHHGGHIGAVPLQMTACAPPNENCDPPSEDCAPKKLTGCGPLKCKSRPKFVFFVDWHRISCRFWDEDLFVFLFGDHLFSAGKTAWIFDFGRKIPCNFIEDLLFCFVLFLEITCFRPE